MLADQWRPAGAGKSGQEVEHRGARAAVDKMYGGGGDGEEGG